MGNRLLTSPGDIRGGYKDLASDYDALAAAHYEICDQDRATLLHARLSELRCLVSRLLERHKTHTLFEDQESVYRIRVIASPIEVVRLR